jgi:hypothetical protein
MTLKQIEPMLVDAPLIATPERHAVSVEEFEDFDGHLAPVIEAIAEPRCRELAILGVTREVDHDRDHFGHRVSEKEAVMGDLVELTHAGQGLEQTPHIRFLVVQENGDVAHARRPKSVCTAKVRPDPFP